MLVRRNTNSYMPSIFDAFFNELDINRDSELFTKPKFNVYETESEFVVEAAAPGLEKKDFKIDVNDNVLKISSEKEVKEEKKNQKYYYKGFSYGSFMKTYKLPDHVKKEEIAASYDNGVLKIVIPKDKETKLKHQVEIA